MSFSAAPLIIFLTIVGDGISVSSALECTNKFTTASANGGGNVVYLDRHQITCEPGSALSQFRLTNFAGNKTMGYQYKCCKTQFPTLPDVERMTKATKVPKDEENTFYLDRQTDVRCLGKALISYLR
jgi:hypothetical protein